MRTVVLAATALALLQPAGASAAQPSATSGQAMDRVFAENVARWTTRKEFTSPLVDHLPVSSAVPSPREVLGHDIGVPRVLDDSAALLGYFRDLAGHLPSASWKIDGTGGSSPRVFTIRP